MRRTLVILAIVSCAFTWVLATDPSISIVLDKNYSKTGAIKLNGKHVAGSHVLNTLSKAITEKGRNFPVVILMPQELTFNDWQAIRGLIGGKVGFLNDRYFVYSSKTQMMTEIDPPHRAVEFSPSPPSRSAREANY